MLIPVASFSEFASTESAGCCVNPSIVLWRYALLMTLPVMEKAGLLGSVTRTLGAGNPEPERQWLALTIAVVSGKGRSANHLRFNARSKAQLDTAAGSEA